MRTPDPRYTGTNADKSSARAMHGRNRIAQQRLANEKEIHDEDLRDRIDEYVAREEFELALAREKLKHRERFRRAELIVRLMCVGKEEAEATACVDRLLCVVRSRKEMHCDD